MAGKIADERIWQKEKQAESPTGEWTGEWTGECEGQFWERARKLTASLTLEEKIGMIHGTQLFQTKGVERLGIPPLVMSDGPWGCARNSSRMSGGPLAIRMIMSLTFPATAPWRLLGTGSWRRSLGACWGRRPGEEGRM